MDYTVVRTRQVFKCACLINLKADTVRAQTKGAFSPECEIISSHVMTMSIILCIQYNTLHLSVYRVYQRYVL